jgi:hypothetical protein
MPERRRLLQSIPIPLIPLCILIKQCQSNGVESNDCSNNNADRASLGWRPREAVTVDTEVVHVLGLIFPWSFLFDLLDSSFVVGMMSYNCYDLL